MIESIMAGKPKYSASEIIVAMQACKLSEGNQQGLITRTAKHLECTRQTVHNYKNRHRQVWETYMKIRFNWNEEWLTEQDIHSVLRFNYCIA